MDIFLLCFSKFSPKGFCVVISHMNLRRFLFWGIPILYCVLTYGFLRNHRTYYLVLLVINCFPVNISFIFRFFTAEHAVQYQNRKLALSNIFILSWSSIYEINICISIYIIRSLLWLQFVIGLISLVQRVLLLHSGIVTKSISFFS